MHMYIYILLTPYVRTSHYLKNILLCLHYTVIQRLASHRTCLYSGPRERLGVCRDRVRPTADGLVDY